MPLASDRCILSFICDSKSSFGNSSNFHTMALKTLLILALYCILLCDGHLRTKPTKGDKLTLLGRRNRNYFVGLNSRRAVDLFLPQARAFKCRVLTTVYQNAVAKYRNLPGENVLLSQMRNLLRSCPGANFRSGDIFNQTFIFPGTKWCGQGNIAENFHDLGVFNRTDACCRDHDFCDDIIQPGKTKHTLINPYGTTRLHCKCDEALRQCFRKVNSAISHTVGYIFFSLLQTQCFDYDYPTTGCALWRRGAVRLYCVNYAMDETQPKKWQWFDQEPYF